MPPTQILLLQPPLLLQSPLQQYTNPAAPPPLPSAPLWERLILENPWPTAGVLAISAVALLVIMSRTNADRGRRFLGLPVRTLLALALALAGGIVMALGMAITTDRESIKAGSRRLVEVTAATDMWTLDSMLATDARLHLPSGVPGGGGGGGAGGAGGGGGGIPKDRILDMVEEFLGPRGRYPVTDVRIPEVQATLDGPRVARTQLRIRVTPEATAFPYTSWWRIDWRKDGEGAAARWKVVGIEPLVLPGVR